MIVNLDRFGRTILLLLCCCFVVLTFFIFMAFHRNRLRIDDLVMYQMFQDTQLSEP